jgi:hypothetical protein
MLFKYIRWIFLRIFAIFIYLHRQILKVNNMKMQFCYELHFLS